MADQHVSGAPPATSHRRVGPQSVVHQREFAAAAALVQRAHVERDLFAQWMGPRGTTVRFDRFDPTSGGGFRYVVESGSGGAWAFRGSYHDVSPGRIVHTWEFEGETGVTLETLRFSDLDEGRSLLEITSTHVSEAACDAMLASGMDAGMDEDFDRLDALLPAILRTATT